MKHLSNDPETILLDPPAVARALGGNVSGWNVVAPGPGHSRTDRSLSVKIDPTAPDGFIVYSFAGDSLFACRDYVRAALGLGARERSFRQSSSPSSHRRTLTLDKWNYRSALAVRFWNKSRDPRGTVVESYLASRGLTLPDDIAGDVIRFHSALKWNGTAVSGLVALFRDVRTNVPCGIHRTFLDNAGTKLDRKMLGRARAAAIKLDPDENVTLGLCIGEGIETCLAAWLAGFRPVWALGSAGAIDAFPVLGGNRGDHGFRRDRRRRCESARGANVRGALDEGWARGFRGETQSRRRSERRLAGGGVMMTNFPPPDPRLNGKVEIEQIGGNGQDQSSRRTR